MVPIVPKLVFNVKNQLFIDLKQGFISASAGKLRTVSALQE